MAKERRAPWRHIAKQRQGNRVEREIMEQLQSAALKALRSAHNSGGNSVEALLVARADQRTLAARASSTAWVPGRQTIDKWWKLACVEAARIFAIELESRHEEIRDVQSEPDSDSILVCTQPPSDAGASARFLIPPSIAIALWKRNVV
jgi:hypothetical protein